LAAAQTYNDVQDRGASNEEPGAPIWHVEPVVEHPPNAQPCK